jgi:pyruvate kinase
MTQSGNTARRVAAFRPSVPVVAASPPSDALGRLGLVWGVRPLLVPHADEHDQHLTHALQCCDDAGLVHSGDLVAVVSASPGPRAGSTDVVRVVRV